MRLRVIVPIARFVRSPLASFCAIGGNGSGIRVHFWAQDRCRVRQGGVVCGGAKGKSAGQEEKGGTGLSNVVERPRRLRYCEIGAEIERSVTPAKFGMLPVA